MGDWAFISGKVRRVNIDVGQSRLRRSEADDDPTVSAMANAGPTSRNPDCASATPTRRTARRSGRTVPSSIRKPVIRPTSSVLTDGLMRLSLLAKKSSDVAITSPPSADDETSFRQRCRGPSSPVRNGRNLASNSSSGIALCSVMLRVYSCVLLR